MTALKVAMIFLPILCCYSQVHSNPKIMETEYEFRNRRLLLGKNHIDKTALVYAVCLSDSYNRTARCTIILDSDSFDESKLIQSCSMSLSTEIATGSLEFLEVNIWNDDKAIFSWLDIDNNDLRRAQLMILTVHMEKCRKKLLSWTVDNLQNNYQIFIIPNEDSYFLSFPDSLTCYYNFCKMIVYDDGIFSPPINWFPRTNLIYDIEPVISASTYIVITANNYSEEKNVQYFWISENVTKEVGGHKSIDDLSWTTSNGLISFCSFSNCMVLNSQGGLLYTKLLNMRYLPVRYHALYNLRNGKQLAFICDDKPKSDYRVIKIGIYGEQEYSFSIEDLKCARKYDYLTSKFFRLSDTEYCLVLFHSVYARVGKLKFNSYCFTFNESS